MTIREKLATIKKIVFNEDITEAASEDVRLYVEAKGADGEIYRATPELIVDAIMTRITEAGEEVVEAGEYVLEDDIMVITAEGGLIVSVDAIETEPEAEPEAEAEVVEFQALVLSTLTDLNNKMIKLSQENLALKKQFVKFSAEPSVEKTNTKVNLGKPVSKEDKLKFLGKR